VLEEIAKRDTPPVDTPDPSIGLSEKEVKRFSFMKLVRALADPAKADEAGFELECSRAFEDKTGKTAKGAYIPHDVLANEGYLQRDLATNVGTTGGYLVETTTGSFIEMLRNSAAVMRLGTRVLTGLVGDIDIPKQTGGATAYWVNEGADLTESQQTLGQIRMSPKTIGCYTDITRRMMLQSSVDVENFVRQDFALQMGIAIDLGALTGDAASGEPRGLLNVSGIGSVTLNAANTPDWGDIVDLETAIATDNALFGSLAYLTNATIVGNMKQTEKASSTGKFIYEDGMLNGYPCELSNNVTAKYILFGNWADMIIAMWSGLDVTVDTNSLSTSGGTRIVCFQDIDVAVRHAESFASGYKA
jgi:HK97 family phage major capsid protein